MDSSVAPLIKLELSTNWAPARRAYVAAYGFEDRALAWLESALHKVPIHKVVFIKYVKAKGANKITDARALAERRYPRASISEVAYTSGKEELLEKRINQVLQTTFRDIDEIVLDISAQTKLLILLWIVMAVQAGKTVRVIYSEAAVYPPSQAQYEKVRATQGARFSLAMAGFPSYGAQSIIRTKTLSSIRMQGQPSCLIAFTSFNEQLVKHIMGSINPHRLLLINGMPPRLEMAWRAHATQDLHKRLLEEYPADNLLDPATGLLQRTVSTLDPADTLRCLEEIYRSFGGLERLIAVGTGSKMQTVGLAAFRVLHPDVHVEYVTPDSYYFPGQPKGVAAIHSMELSLVTANQAIAA